ncbi:MAG: archaeosortase/exosortase family protein [Gammaproteobacteria bacterium]|nr:archaeosortase/exosortase family protein [Gammaproteobacteria bacterium]
MSCTNPQRPIFLGALLLTGLFCVYWGTFLSLFLFWWSSPTYGYGILVMPISFYLVWRKRVEVCRSEIKPSFFGLLLFLGASCIWWAAKIVDVQIMQGLAFIIMIPGLLLTFFGFRVVKIISFPLAYLFIAIPIWSFLEPPLQNITVIIVTSILRLVDVPVFLENNLISIPEG